MKLYDFYNKQKKKKRNMSNCITFNSYALSLDEAFDVVIRCHPEWLEIYPQLKTEYSISNCTKKKTFCKK